MTSYVISEKGEEVISERHQKDFNRDENTEATQESDDDKKEENVEGISNEFTDVDFDDIQSN